MSAIIAGGTSTKLIETYNISSPQITSKGPAVNTDRSVQSRARTDAPVALDASLTPSATTASSPGV